MMNTSDAVVLICWGELETLTSTCYSSSVACRYVLHTYTIERIFELLYINFMKKHEQGGKVVKKVLRLLED